SRTETGLNRPRAAIDERPRWCYKGRGGAGLSSASGFIYLRRRRVMDRRDFLKKGTTTAAGLAALNQLPEPLAKADETAGSQKPIPRRKLGKTGEELSIVGFAGIVVMNNSQSFANNIVAEAVDRGINYFDVAPTYGDAQARLGPALEPYRKNVFLACKEGAGREEGDW